MSNSEDYRNIKIKITEMFMAKAGDQWFYGIIKWSKDAKGNSHLLPRRIINKGNVQACASDQKMLAKMLGEMCVMVLDFALHTDTGGKIKLFNEDYFLN